MGVKIGFAAWDGTPAPDCSSGIQSRKIGSLAVLSGAFTDILLREVT
jgi:hypothetical protein